MGRVRGLSTSGNQRDTASSKVGSPILSSCAPASLDHFAVGYQELGAILRARNKDAHDAESGSRRAGREQDLRTLPPRSEEETMQQGSDAGDDDRVSPDIGSRGRPAGIHERQQKGQRPDRRRARQGVHEVLPRP